MQPHVLVLFNAPTLPPEHPDLESEREVLETTEIVAAILQAAEFRVTRLGISDDPLPLLHLLRTDRPDVVFNLFEGTAQQGQTEAYVAGLLEWSRIPYTGCPFQSVVLSRDKPRAKLLLRGADLPTPPFFVANQRPVPTCNLTWPVIVKPAAEDASVGLDQGSVVTDQAQLADRVDLLLSRYGPPILVEEFVDGRECNVAVVEYPELRVLPVSEIVFAQRGAGHWPIVTYDAKWTIGSPDDLATTPHCPAELEPGLADRLRDLAARAFQLFGCRQYARVDFRVSRQDEPSILEINANPDFHPTVGLNRSLTAAGISHTDFTIHLVQALLTDKTFAMRRSSC